MKDIEAVWCASSARSDLGALGVREDVVVLPGGAREGPVLGLGRVVDADAAAGEALDEGAAALLMAQRAPVVEHIGGLRVGGGIFFVGSGRVHGGILVVRARKDWPSAPVFTGADRPSHQVIDTFCKGRKIQGNDARS